MGIRAKIKEMAGDNLPCQYNPVTCQPIAREKRWKSLSAGSRKRTAAQELEISLSTPDRKIRKGELEVVREGRRVYVRMHGPEYPDDEELLRRAIIREDELERTVRRLERSASELERERDEAREAASASRDAYEEMEETYRKERAAHGRTRELASRLKVAVAGLVVLLVISILVAWLLAT